MQKIKVQKNTNYTVMCNHHFRNNTLSFKAMGLLSFLLSLPDGWNLSVEGLSQCAKDGRDSITAGLNELEKAGHLVRRKVRDERGRIIDTEYIIYEEPQLPQTAGEAKDNVIEVPILENESSGKSDLPSGEKNEKNMINSTFPPFTENPETVKKERISPFTENPFTENPLTGKPLTENPQQINTIELNTNKININKINTKGIKIDELSSSSKDKKNNIKESLKYDAAVKASSEEIVRSVYEEIIKAPELLHVVDAQIFKTVCESIALYSNSITNKQAYIKTCISNVIEASKINNTTFNGSRSHPPDKKKEEIRVYAG